MADIIAAIESVVAMPAWHERVLAWAPSAARLCAEGRRRLPRLRLPSERQRAAAHRDQHQRRRRPAQCRAGAGAEGLLRGGVRRAARRASCRHHRAGVCRHVHRGVAGRTGRCAARAHRHRGRAAARAVPLPGIPAVPEALRAARHRGDDLRSGRTALRGRALCAWQRAHRPGLQSPDGFRPGCAGECGIARGLSGRRGGADAAPARACRLRRQAQPEPAHRCGGAGGTRRR